MEGVQGNRERQEVLALAAVGWSQRKRECYSASPVTESSAWMHVPAHVWGKHQRAVCELLITCARRMMTDKNVGVVKMVLSWLWLQSCSLD